MRKSATFRDPHAPIISQRKRRRAVIKAALEATVTGDRTNPNDRAAARRLLGEVGRIERERPNSTLMGMVRVADNCMSIWVYEPKLAPIESAPEAILKRNAALNSAFQALR